MLSIPSRCCQLLSMTLNAVGIENVCLHGFMRQRERVAALNKFKSNHVRTLIATDVASRGLDIPNVQLVMNHRLPKQAKEYIHRVGRTARAGRHGMAISIFRFPRDLEFLSDIEAAINTKLTEHSIDQRMVERIFMQVNVSKRECEMALDNKDFDERAQIYRRKKWIENGDDPDEMENKWNQQQKDKRKQRKKSEKEYLARKKREREANAVAATTAAGDGAEKPELDERFAHVNAAKFQRKRNSKAIDSNKDTAAKNSKMMKIAKNPLKLGTKSSTISQKKAKKKT